VSAGDCGAPSVPVSMSISQRLRSKRKITYALIIFSCALFVAGQYDQWLFRNRYFSTGIRFVAQSSTGIIRRVAVIGSAGYIGSRLHVFLELSDFDVVGFDRDASSSHSLTLNQLKTIHMNSSDISGGLLRSFDAVVYLGGLTGRKVCDTFPGDTERENVHDILNLARRMSSDQVLIFASTSAIAEGAANEPADEKWQVLEERLDTYSRSMFKRERALSALSQENNTPRMIGLRFGTVVGVSDSQRQEMAYLAFVKSVFTAGSMEVYHPETQRSWLWMDDLLSAIRAVLQRSNKLRAFQVFNLSSFHGTIAKVAADVSALTGAIAHHRPHEGPDVPGFLLNSTAFSETFNFQFSGTSQNVVQELVLKAPQVVVGRNKNDSPREPRWIPSQKLCIVCGAEESPSDVMSVLDLGEQPLANDFREDAHDSLSVDRFPLRLVRCRSCNHVQLSHIVERPSLFTKYLYRSGTTSTLKEHFIRLAHRIDQETIASTGRKTVLEIACNDGSQLNQFSALGWDTYGVDPAANIVDLAIKEGHKVKVGFWGVGDFSNFLPTFLDAIVAQNVFAHVPDPVKFLKDCRRYMSLETKLYIQTSQCDMFETGQFDTTYHEHIHFFTAHSFQRAADLADLDIVDFDIVSIHGRSCLVTFMKRSPEKSNSRLRSFTMEQRLEFERKLGMTEDFYYAKFRYLAQAVQRWIHTQLQIHSADGYDVIGYGAAAKGIVLLHSLLAQLEQSYDFKFVVDDEPFKQGRFCPGTTIPVQATSSLHSSDRPMIIVIFAWNFAAEIQSRLSDVFKDSKTEIKLLIPFPEQRIVSLHSDSKNSLLVTRFVYAPRPWPSLFKLGRRRVVLYSHTYNEEILIPYWIQHHAHMFDRAYIFDYASTDSTVELIKRLAPSSWTVIESSNTDFSAGDVDKEIMQMEALCDDCWKVALTTTEFLVHEDLRSELANRDAQSSNSRCIKLPMVTMVDDGKKQLLKHKSLISQKSIFALAVHKSMFTAPRHYVRYLHNLGKGEYSYGPGRHALKTEKNIECDLSHNAIILKYKFSPWPEVRERLAQIGSRIPLEDEKLGRGVQHTLLKNDVKAVEEAHRVSLTWETRDALELYESCVEDAAQCLPQGYCMTCAVHRTVRTMFS